MTGADVVAEARRWIGTPWQHQAAVRGAATDCLGLVAGVGIALNLDGSERWKKDSRALGYGRVSDRRLITVVCAEYLDDVPLLAMREGDVLFLSCGEWPNHFGILSQRMPPRIVHAFASIGSVRENTLSNDWRSRVLRVYRFRGLEA